MGLEVYDSCCPGGDFLCKKAFKEHRRQVEDTVVEKFEKNRVEEKINKFQA